MVVMISQPMQGKTQEQIIKEREAIEKDLLEEGHDVVNMVSDKAPTGVDEAVYMLGKSIEYMSEADAVVFMPGWENARGCKIEYEIATKYGKFVKLL